MENNSKKEWDLNYIPKENDKYHDCMDIISKTKFKNTYSPKIKFFFRLKNFFKKKYM